jgi:hypothetical protein
MQDAVHVPGVRERVRLPTQAMEARREREQQVAMAQMDAAM